METRTNPFYELYDRLYAAAAAGTAVISEDFRLHRAVDAFAPLAQKNKVFTRLHEKCAGLFTSSNVPSDIADCIALAEALAVTMGSVPEVSKTRPADCSLRFTPHEIPYSELSVLKYEISHAPKTSHDFPDSLVGYANDPRLVCEYLAVCDSNSENVGKLSRYFENACGKSLIQPLLDSIRTDDPKATGRQIEFLSRIAGAAMNDQYKAFAIDENAPTGVRIRAIEALRLLPENADLLIELFRTTKNKVNIAALEAIASINPPQAEPIFDKLAGKYKSAYAESFSRANYPACTKCAVEQADKWIAETKYSYIPPDTAHMLCGKSGILDCLDRLAQKIQQETIGNDFNPKRFRRILITNILFSSSPVFADMIEQLYAKYPDLVFFAKFLSDLLQNKPDSLNFDSELTDRHLDEIMGFLDRLHTGNDGYWFRMTPEYQDWMLPEVRIFDHIPEKLLALIADAPLDAKGNSEVWTGSLVGIIKNRSLPADLDNLKKAAVSFALHGCKQNPSRDGIQILHKYASLPAGAISDYILWTLKKHKRVMWLYAFPEFGIDKETLRSEFTNAIDRINTEMKNELDAASLHNAVENIRRQLENLDKD